MKRDPKSMKNNPGWRDMKKASGRNEMFIFLRDILRRIRMEERFCENKEYLIGVIKYLGHERTRYNKGYMEGHYDGYQACLLNEDLISKEEYNHRCIK